MKIIALLAAALLSGCFRAPTGCHEPQKIINPDGTEWTVQFCRE